MAAYGWPGVSHRRPVLPLIKAHVLPHPAPASHAGHYELDLLLAHHRGAAQRLADLAAAEGDAATWRDVAWETEVVAMSSGPPDSWRGIIPSK